MALSKKLHKLGRDPVGFFLDSRHPLFRRAAGRYVHYTAQRALRLYNESGRNIPVSVIMPAYNAAAWIDAAIESLLAQTHPPAEIIIIDDASTDDTLAKIAGWQQKDDRVQAYRSTGNNGPYVCKNFGLAHARHDIVTFTDADDISLPGRIALQLGYLLRTGAIACVCRRAYCDENMKPVHINGAAGGNALCALMVRREAALSHAGYFDCVPFAADSEYVDRLRATQGRRAVRTLPVVLYHARQHGSSITHSGSGSHDWTHSKDSELKTRLNPLRKAYHDAYRAWHARISGLPVDMGGAPFPLPAGMERRQAHPIIRL